MDNQVENPWIFLTGASGYIGSHLSAELKSRTSYNLMQIDQRAKLLPHTTRFCDIFADEDFASPLVLSSIMQYRPETVIHLAASSTIGPGQSDPLKYWKNNVSRTIKLIHACVDAGVKNFIFASTSSVYGNNGTAESSEIEPITAYARTKYAIEMALADCWHSHRLNSLSFRFFNAAGAHHFHDLGELYGSSHLVAKIMEAIIHQNTLTVYGRDYHTTDGTAIRDYTHVLDIVDAIILGIEWLKSGKGYHKINLGSGTGYSVQEVIDQTEHLFNLAVPYRYGDRRDGDSERRTANISLAKEMLNWTPTRNLDDILRDSYKWYSSNTYKDLYAKKIWYDN
jgi:UDP-glucose 4-epimerase